MWEAIGFVLDHSSGGFFATVAFDASFTGGDFT